MVQVIPFAGARTHASKDAIATMPFSNIVDQFLNDNSLADTCTTKSSDLTTFHEGTDQVDNLNACLEDLNLWGLVFQRRRMPVNGIAGSILNFRLVVDRLAQ